MGTKILENILEELRPITLDLLELDIPKETRADHIRIIRAAIEFLSAKS